MRRRPASAAPRWPARGPSWAQPLGQGDQIVTGAVKVPDQTDLLVARAQVEAPRPALALQAGGLDADGPGAALAQLALDPPQQGRAQPVAAVLGRGDHPVD